LGIKDRGNMGKFMSRKTERNNEEASKTVWMREDGIEVYLELEGILKERFVPLKLKKKSGRCTILEPENACDTKRDNTILKTLVEAHLWKRQLEEGKP
jgi:site-specific DNA recombinase